jgi:hypothetical protein
VLAALASSERVMTSRDAKALAECARMRAAIIFSMVALR